MMGRIERRIVRKSTPVLISFLCVFLWGSAAQAGLLSQTLPPARTVSYGVVAAPQIDANDGRLAVSWVSGSGSNFSTSLDRGASWSEFPVTGLSGIIGRPLLPRVEFRGLSEMNDGSHILIGGDYQEVALFRTPDRGQTWSKQSLAYVPPVDPFQAISIGDAKVWSDGMNVYFFYVLGSSVSFPVREIHMRVSTNGGATFGPDRTIASFPTTYNFPNLRLSVDFPRMRLAVWSSFVSSIYYLESLDAGATWTVPSFLAGDNYVQAEDGWQDEHVAMAGFGDRVFVTYTDPYLRYRFVRSDDGGRTVSFTSIIPQDPGFEFRQGANLFAFTADHLLLVYSARKWSGVTGSYVADIYAQESEDGGLTWSAPALLTSFDAEDNRMTMATYDRNRSTIWIVYAGLELVSPYRQRVVVQELPICNTDIGAPVRLYFPPDAVVTFDQVTACGTTTFSRDTVGANPGTLTAVTAAPYLHIATTAATVGGVSVDVNYAAAGLSADQARRLRIYSWDGTNWVDATSGNIAGETITARLATVPSSATFLLAVPPVAWDVKASPDRINVDRAGDVIFFLRNFDGYNADQVDLSSIRIDGLVPYQVLIDAGVVEAYVWKNAFTSYPRNVVLNLPVTGKMMDGTPARGKVNVITYNEGDPRPPRPTGGAMSATSVFKAAAKAVISFFKALFKALGV